MQLCCLPLQQLEHTLGDAKCVFNVGKCFWIEILLHCSVVRSMPGINQWQCDACMAQYNIRCTWYMAREGPGRHVIFTSQVAQSCFVSTIKKELHTICTYISHTEGHMLQDTTLCRAEVLCNKVPVDQLPKECLDVVRPPVLNVKIVGMLPHIHCKQWCSSS